MKSYTKCLILSLLCSLSTIGCGASAVDDEFYKNKMIENMEIASRWVVKDGIKVFVEEGKNGVFRKLLDEWGVQLWVDPWLEEERYLAQFRIKARGINYQVFNLYREKVGNYYYEFWLNRIEGESWSGETRRSEFFVVRTDDVYGSREILEHSDQFIESYRAFNEVIAFPTDNLDLLYDMEPWLYPDNYKDTDIKDRVVIIENGIAKFEELNH